MYFFTSYTDKNTLLEALDSYDIDSSDAEIKISAYGLTIKDGDDYFLNQREGMINFYSTLMNEKHMNVHSKFIMHLASCMKGYYLESDNFETATPVLNTLIERLSGLIFSPDMTFYTTDWQVVINSGGACEVTDYEVKMAASTYDNQVNTTDIAIERKNKTIRKLDSLNIPTLDSLPVIPDESNVTYRNEKELITRVIILAAVAVKGELKTSDISLQVLEKYTIHPDDVSPWELSFLQHKSPQDQEFVNAIWRYESLYVLLWATGLIDELHFPDQIAPLSAMVEIIRDHRDMDDILASVNTREMYEILDELDLIYRLHWCCVDARIKNKIVPSQLNPSVIYERHYALNWLIDRYQEDWDHISTDT